MNTRGYHPILNEAALAVVEDDGQRLRECLQSAEDQASDQAPYWLLRAYVSSTLKECGDALQQALQIDPENPIGLSGLSWIRGIREIADLQLDAKRQSEREQAEAEARQAELERIRAEQEAIRRAEAAAREKAAEEARLKAEQEAQRRIADQARQQAEQELRRQAELERLHAEQEKRLREEEEARLEALLQADQDAQKKTEQKKNEETLRQLDVEPAAEHADPQPFQAQNNDPQPRTDAETIPSPFSPMESGTASPANAAGDDESNIGIESQLQQQLQSLAHDVRQQIDHAQPVTDHPVESATDQPVEAATDRPLILAVDQSTTVQELISMTLTPHGYDVITAGDGVQALSLIAGRLPDLILFDLNMPKIGGHKLCNFVKKHDRTRHIPVVMLSGKEGLFDKMRGRMNGCDAFIAKPLESEQLIETVRERLATQPANADATPSV